MTSGHFCTLFNHRGLTPSLWNFQTRCHLKTRRSTSRSNRVIPGQSPNPKPAPNTQTNSRDSIAPQQQWRVLPKHIKRLLMRPPCLFTTEHLPALPPRIAGFCRCEHGKRISLDPLALVLSKRLRPLRSETRLHGSKHLKRLLMGSPCLLHDRGSSARTPRTAEFCRCKHAKRISLDSLAVVLTGCLRAPLSETRSSAVPTTSIGFARLAPCRSDRMPARAALGSPELCSSNHINRLRETRSPDTNDELRARFPSPKTETGDLLPPPISINPISSLSPSLFGQMLTSWYFQSLEISAFPISRLDP